VQSVAVRQSRNPEAVESPVKFTEAGEAVAWADEILSRCAPEGQFARLLRTPGGSAHGDHLSAGLDVIVEMIEAEARQRIPDAKLRTGYQIRVLALSLIHRERRRLLGKRYSNAKIAEDLEISRKTLDGRAWKALIAGMTRIIREWADAADRQLVDMLAEAGMMR